MSSYPRKTLAALAAGVAVLSVAAASVTTLSIGSGGTAIDKIVRTTATVDVSPIPAVSATTTPVTLTGASVNDDCDVTVLSGDYLSTTSTGRVSCRITATNTATVYFLNTAVTSSFDAASSVFAVKAISY